MNELLANIVRKQKNEAERILRVASVKRSLEQKIRASLREPSIKVISGPRRAGKSTLALQALKGSEAAYFNFEDEELQFDYDGEKILGALREVYPGYKIILFDEIQLFPNWEKLVNRLNRIGENIIITGSNSKMLSSELSSSLTGRYKEFQLLPFSFSEYILATKKSAESDSFMDFLTTGGFPTVVTGRSSGKEFLKTLWDAIILKDLVQRYRVRRVSELKSLLYLALTNMASRCSIRSLERAINHQLSHSTISKFLSWAESGYLVCALENYSHKARERVNSEKKFYLFDNGFYSAHQLSGGRDYGKLLENFVFIELVRRGFVPNLTLFSYKTNSSYEVDFYLPPSSGKASLIQVAYSISSQTTLARETRALIAAANELNAKNLYIISCDDAEQKIKIDDHKITVLPAWEISSIIESQTT